VSVTLDYLLEPLSHWLDDQAVEEVCINGPGEAWVYSRGAFARHDVPALDVDWIAKTSPSSPRRSGVRTSATAARCSPPTLSGAAGFRQ
jgi:hypothetical protein